MENFRNIISNTVIGHATFSMAIDRYTQAISSVGSMNGSVGYALVGEARAGKTTLVNHLQNIYTSERNELGLIQPVVYCCVPSEPSLKGMAEALFSALNDPFVGTKKSSKDETANAIKSRSVKLIEECGVKAVIFDESQHFVRKPGSAATYSATEWLKTLMDKTSIVYIMAGLNSTVSLFDQNEQLPGRCMSTIRLNRFNWMENEARSEFISILSAFNEKLYQFDLPEFTNHEIAFRFYMATGGLLGYLSKLLTQAVWDAIFEKRTCINLMHFEIAYEKSMRVSNFDNAVNPFSSKFNPVPSGETIANANLVGVHIPDPRQRKNVKKGH